MRNNPIKLIILDRDGVINEDSSTYIKTPDEWHAIPGSLEAITKLTKNNYQVVVATNQAGVARGLFSLETLKQIHFKMITEVEKFGGHLDDIFFCPHGPNDNCNCRKPKPGLILAILQKFNLLPAQVLLIGDSLRDLEAAKAAGVAAILVKTGNGKLTLSLTDKITVPVYKDLAEAVTMVLKENKSSV